MLVKGKGTNLIKCKWLDILENGPGQQMCMLFCLYCVGYLHKCTWCVRSFVWAVLDVHNVVHMIFFVDIGT